MATMKPKILIQLDTDPQPSVFDAVVAADAGADHLFRHGGVTAENVRDLVYGALFTRGPADLAATAIFIGGSNVAAGEAVLGTVKQTFFGPFRVSVLFDANGANTTAAAAVLACLQGRGGSLQGEAVAVLAATGPVGQRAARLLARLGAKVSVGSRSLERASELAKSLQQATGQEVSPFATTRDSRSEQGAAGQVGPHQRGRRGRLDPAGFGLEGVTGPQGPDRPERRPPARHRGNRSRRQGDRSRRRPCLGCPGRRRLQDEDPQEGDPGTVHLQRQGLRRRGGPRTGAFSGLTETRPKPRGIAVIRVVGSDPGTSSLDLVLLVEGSVADQVRFLPAQLRDDPEILARQLNRWSPLDLVAAPSGYGLPLVRGDAFSDDHLDQISLVRPDERGRDSGVLGFRAWVRGFCRIRRARWSSCRAACICRRSPLTGRRMRSTSAPRTRWPSPPWRCGLTPSRGAGLMCRLSRSSRSARPSRRSSSWTGEGSSMPRPGRAVRSGCVREAAGTGNWLTGGLGSRRTTSSAAAWPTWARVGPAAIRESLIKHLAGLKAVTPFERIYVSGRGLEEPEIARMTTEALARFGASHPPALAPRRLGQACRTGRGPPRRCPGRRPVCSAGRITAVRIGFGVGLGCGPASGTPRP